MREAFRSLSTNPGLGHRREDLTSQNVLFFLVNPYFVIYRVEDEGVVIHVVIPQRSGHESHFATQTCLGASVLSLK